MTSAATKMVDKGSPDAEGRACEGGNLSFPLRRQDMTRPGEEAGAHGRRARPAGAGAGLVERLFSPSPAREDRSTPKVCNCPEDEIQRLAAAMVTRSSSGSGQRGPAKGTDAETQRGAHGTGDASAEQKPSRRRGRLVASLERAARRRLNGALGDSRAPSHYQAILPSKGIREREWRLWRLETGSQLRSPEGRGIPEGCQSRTPWSSSVDTLTSPGQPEN